MLITRHNEQLSPLLLDAQNASWSAKQSSTLPLSGQNFEEVTHWYVSNQLTVGLVVPVLKRSSIILDCIDRIDLAQGRIRTNVAGWFVLNNLEVNNTNNNGEKINDKRLLKPNKKVMIAACTGHTWQGNSKLTPLLPSLRELLLSCNINWKNFKKTSVVPTG